MELKGRGIEVLKSFSKIEMKEFGKFLDSSYHNTNGRLSEFFNALRNYYPDFNQNDFTDETLYSLVFGKSKYNYQVLKNLMSQLYKKENEFLVLQALANDKNGQKIYLLNELSFRKVDSAFWHELDKAKKENSSWKTISESYFLYSWKLASSESSYLIDSGEQEKTGKLLNEMCENAIVNFFSSIWVNTYSTLVFNEFNYNLSEIGKLAETFLDSFDFEKVAAVLDKNYDGSHYLRHNLQFIKLCHGRFKNIGSTALDMKKDLMNNIGKYNELLKFQMSENLSSLFAAEINSGKLDNINEYAELIKYKQENKLLFGSKQKYLNPLAFMGDLTIIILSKNFEYAKEFICKCEDLLAPADRKDLIKLAYSRYHMSKGEYEKVIELLASITTPYFVEKYYVKGSLIKCFYELKDYEQVFSIIESYRKFLHRNKNISKTHKEHNLAYLSYHEKITKLKIKKDTGEKIDKFHLESLHHEIKSAPRVNSRVYLLEKVDEISAL